MTEAIDLTKNQASQIDLEMFEVGLGSAIYLRLRRQDGDIRILADGGVDKGNGFTDDHVLAKLKAVFAQEGNKEPRIDLMIATHYDEDHLRGLVPIVRAGIEIGDVWLPPVASEDRYTMMGSQPERSDMLGEAVTSVEGLVNYLRKRGQEISHAISLLAQLGVEGSNISFEGLDSPRFPQFPDDQIDDERLEALVFPFRVAYKEAGGPEAGCEHADAADLIDPLGREEIPVWLDIDAIWDSLDWRHQPDRDSFNYWTTGLKLSGRTAPAILSLRHIVKMTARKAINAAALHRLTAALAKADPKVVPQYRTISRGIPEDFRWDPAVQRFEHASGPGIAETQIALLGPSDWLVAKFRDRLPARVATYFALTRHIPVKSTTPSNDLSYVLTVVHAGQSILICGDTGMWDFKVGRKAFETTLLSRLTDVSVAQVAHHAGNNRYFYHSLCEAWRGRTDAMPYLLISHAENDAFRPSAAFEKFVRTGWDSNARNLLFTSQPLPANVQHFRHYLHPLVGVATPVGRCDIRMHYCAAGWAVVQHGIKA